MIVTSALFATVPTEAAAEGATGAERRALQVALEDPRVQDRLALRPGEYEVDVSRPTTSDAEASQWVVRWSREGTTLLSAAVDLDDGAVVPRGQTLVVMPHEGALTFAWFERPVVLMGWLAAFLSALAFGVTSRRMVLMLLPLAIIAVAFSLTIANVVSSSWIRAGNMVLFGAALLALLAGAWIWSRPKTISQPPSSPRLPTWSWLTVCGAGILGQLVAIDRSFPIDVGIASSLGASLMRVGLPVYGNSIDTPGILLHGDTYGPVAYLAYVPATALTDDPRLIAGMTNLALAVLVAGALLLIGHRAGSLRHGAWAAAVWLTCPFVVVGVAVGNNDVVVAACLTALAVVVGRPAYRGVAVAAAAATKFLPAIVILLVLRAPGEGRRATGAVIAGFVTTLLVTFGIGLRGIDALDAFWERAVLFQNDRDDISSFWGLTGLGSLRYVCILFAILLAVRWMTSWRAVGPPVMLGRAASMLALLIAGLPQYWGTYATWLLPLVLAALLPWPAELRTPADHARSGRSDRKRQPDGVPVSDVADASSAPVS